MMRVLGALLAAMAAWMGVAQAGTVTYYHNDIAGSPVVATDAGGNVLWRESYRPYGERLTNAPASVDNRVWFTGRRQDVETGLVYMGARYYDPVIGRFISTDPVGFDEDNLHSHNRYAYANNNPYKYLDPDGRTPALAARLVGQGSFALATRFGAREVGERLGLALWVLMNAKSDAEDSSKGEAGTKDESDTRFPERKLPRDEGKLPKADPEAGGAYTQLGQKEGRSGKYDQAREFDANGKPVRDIDFTDHGRPANHPNPHQHRYLPNPSGGTPQRGPTEPMS